jgi:hypothetical protein
VLDDFDHVVVVAARISLERSRSLHGIFHIINAQRTASAIRSKGAIQRACFGSLATARDLFIMFI